MVSQALFENYFKASLAFATNSPKALSSEIAISESILRFTSISAFSNHSLILNNSCHVDVLQH